MKIINYLIAIALATSFTGNTSGQKKSSGADLRTSADLESHMTFLAFPLLMERYTGSLFHYWYTHRIPYTFGRTGED